MNEPTAMSDDKFRAALAKVMSRDRELLWRLAGRPATYGGVPMTTVRGNVAISPRYPGTPVSGGHNYACRSDGLVVARGNGNGMEAPRFPKPVRLLGLWLSRIGSGLNK